MFACVLSSEVDVGRCFVIICIVLCFPPLRERGEKRETKNCWLVFPTIYVGKVYAW